MTKTGRNDQCPCGSGMKYKRCCLALQREGLAPMNQARRLRLSIHAEIEKINEIAARLEVAVRELGVFIFFADRNGDAWLLEITDSDAVQLARAGEALSVPLDQNPDTITVEWSHAFAIRDRRLFLVDHQDKTELLLADAPVKEISAAMRRIRKKFAPELLEQVHLDKAASGAA